MRFLRRNWFPLGILVAVAGGILLARLGVRLGAGVQTTTNRVLVVGLFLLVGLTLPTESIAAGLREWKLHVYLQTFIFLVCPSVFALAALLVRGSMDGLVAVGFYALGCLPTTVSSCIVFTQASDGNVVGSTFNAAVANVVGVVLSPLILGLFLGGIGRALPAEEVLAVIRSLALTMVLPMLAGQIGRRFVGGFALRYKAGLGVLMNLLMLGVVFLALLAAASRETFVRSMGQMIGPFGLLAATNLGLTALVYGGARLLGLSRESTISALYVAPQKTLAMGAPLLATYFAGSPQVLAAALLPLLFYHPWQLVAAGVIRSLLRGRRPADTR